MPGQEGFELVLPPVELGKPASGAEAAEVVDVLVHCEQNSIAEWHGNC